MKNFTRILSIVMLVAMCMSMFAGSAFADEHVCSNATVTPIGETNSTCVTHGHISGYLCSCGNVYDTDDPATWRHLTKAEFDKPLAAHTPDTTKEVAAKPAQCGTSGNAYYTWCSVCEAMLDENGNVITSIPVINPTGKHDVSSATPVTKGEVGTCLTDGYLASYMCSCGQLIDANGNATTIAAVSLGKGDHSWSAWVEDKAPTAYGYGTEKRECSVCHVIETRKVDPTGVTVEEADYYLELVGPEYWKSGMDPITFYSEYYDLNVYTGTLKIDGKSLDRESYWANKNGQLILGDKFMAKLSAGKHTAQVVETDSRWIESNTVTFYVAATLKPTDTDKHVINSSKSLKFVASDDIQSVMVGGVTLTDPDDFRVNGKYVTLYADFLNDRTAGATYTLTVKTVGGEEASCKFQILTTAQASASPRTGDDSNIALWSAFLLMSGAAVVAVLPRLKKER